MARRRLAADVSAAMLLAACGLVAIPAGAQRAEPPCVLDKCLAPTPSGAIREPDGGAPASQPRVRGAQAPGAFDFYVLALSWSPGFCATGGDAKAPSQCAAGSRLGFVVHGLWPQNTRGYPSDCGPAGRYPSRQALESVRGVYPDTGLARYEWIKHGTCTGQSPSDYFADVKRARDAITVPDGLKAPAGDQTFVPLDLARAFSAVNPGLRPNAMAVTCRQGTLAEVRICLSKDLRGYVTCPEIARGSCRNREMRVPAPR